MPAEWEPMAATWLGWPVLDHREALWGAHYDAVCRAFGLLARTIARYQRCIVAAHAPLADAARAVCGPQVRVVPIAAEDNWLRDCGPIFLVDEHQVSQTAVGFRFNAWGEKYHPHDGCQRAAADIAALAGVPLVRSDMVLEGGAFYVDGQGTLLTTESCLLHPNRNPGLRKTEIEAELRRMLGVQKIVWLPRHAAEVEGDRCDGMRGLRGPARRHDADHRGRHRAAHRHAVRPAREPHQQCGAGECGGIHRIKRRAKSACASQRSSGRTPSPPHARGTSRPR